MAGNAAIWRCTSGSATEANNLSDAIQFNEAPIPSNGKQITQSEFDLRHTITEQGRPKRKNNIHDDTGFEGLTVIVTGSLKDPANNAAVLLVKKWLIEDGYTTTFPKGRFGLRIDDFPGFNLTPTSTRGYFLTDWHWLREGEFKGRAAFVATLVLDGDVGSSPYQW